METPLLVVGIGASAGGLKALESFFQAMPATNGMAFILVQHLDPYYKSELARLLQRHTEMTVAEAEERVVVQPDHVYIIPPGKSLLIRGGVLHLGEPQQPRGRRTPIDDFLRSLASDAGERAICMILSGTGSDGTLGLKSIKENGGVVMAQTPDDAEYDGMPQSAIHTGLVDVVARAPALARKLIEVHQLADLIQKPTSNQVQLMDGPDALYQILAQVQTHTGHTFGSYKRSTILRRIQRRMRVNGFDRVFDYLAFLRDNEDEIEALFKDFLISVTNFFRDPQAFAALERQAIEQILENQKASASLRVWVPGCATGEEAYSLAMLFVEAAERHQLPSDIQIFASDLDAGALAFARAGLYPETIVADVSAERLARFFIHESGRYRIREELSRKVLFTQHNLLADPPFSKLDLVSCRNLLIYLERNIHDRVFDLFHYALRPEGFLFLGGSESADGEEGRFRILDKKHRIYQRQAGSSRFMQMPLMSPNAEGENIIVPETAAGQRRPQLGDLHRQMMLERYAPPSLIVDRDYNIRYLFGDVGRYLHPPEGTPTHNLLRNIHDALRVELRTALFQFFQSAEKLQNAEAIATRSVTLQTGETREQLRLQVEAVRHEGLDEKLALVIFEPVPMRETDGAEEAAVLQYNDDMVKQLEDELQHTRHRMQTVIEEYETANEELQTSNEELQSTNEELRSTTEELETSKEELQSTNEEMQTVNNELKSKIEEVSRANSDLQNLITSIQIATIFLDRELCLKRYTPQATNLFNIIPSDLGRPFAHISHKIDHAKLPGVAADVLHQLKTVEEEVLGKDGRWFFMRMLPYRALDDRIEGVIATFIDISDIKRYQDEIATRGRQQAAVAELGQLALAGLNLHDLMERAVRLVAITLDVPLCKVLELQPDTNMLLLKAGVGWHEGLVGQALVGTGQDSQAGYTLRTDAPVIVDDLSQEKRFSGPQLLIDHNVITGVSVIISGETRPYGVLGAHATEHRLFSEQDAHFLLSMANVVGAAIERKLAEEALQASEERYRISLQNSPVIFARVDADLRYDWIFSPHPDFEASDVVGRRDDELDTGPGIAELIELKRMVLEQGEQERREITFARSDGMRAYDITATPLRNGDGRVTHVVTAALDISRRRQMEEALNESKSLFEAVLQHLPTGVIIAEAPSGRLILGNEQVERIWRHPYLTAEKIEGYRVYKGYHPDGTPYQPEEWPLARAIAKGESVPREEIEFERGDGTRGMLSVSAAPVYDPQGRIKAAVVIFNDITERKLAEAALRDLTESLEKRVSERTAQIRALASELTLAEQRERHRVAAILHDDLQQLLFAVQFQLSALEDTLRKQEMEAATALLADMRAVVDNSINVTRVLSVDLSPPVLQGEGLVEAVQWLAGQMEELHGLHTEVEADAPVQSTSEGMRILLFHLVRELLFNVVKHAGTAQARVTMRQQGNMTIIQVEDKGKGFDATSVSNRATKEGGVGLFHMQERLRLFGGGLEVKSKKEKGTRATIWVPVVGDVFTERWEASA